MGGGRGISSKQIEGGGRRWAGQDIGVVSNDKICRAEYIKELKAIRSGSQGAADSIAQLIAPFGCQYRALLFFSL